MKAESEPRCLIYVIFDDGRKIQTLEAKSEQEVSRMLDQIRARGYVLIAIEGTIPHVW